MENEQGNDGVENLNDSDSSGCLAKAVLFVVIAVPWLFIKFTVISMPVEFILIMVSVITVLWLGYKVMVKDGNDG